jgi:hypothetical protein
MRQEKQTCLKGDRVSLRRRPPLLALHTTRSHVHDQGIQPNRRKPHKEHRDRGWKRRSRCTWPSPSSTRCTCWICFPLKAPAASPSSLPKIKPVNEANLSFFVSGGFHLYIMRSSNSLSLFSLESSGRCGGGCRQCLTELFTCAACFFPALSGITTSTSSPLVPRYTTLPHPISLSDRVVPPQKAPETLPPLSMPDKPPDTRPFASGGILIDINTASGLFLGGSLPHSFGGGLSHALKFQSTRLLAPPLACR